MRHIVNILLLLLIVFLAYMVYNSIKEPIAFGEEREIRKAAVVAKLETIRDAQEIYNGITGKFSSSFADLRNILETDSIPFEKIIGDPDDPNNVDKFERFVTYTMAIDSINAMGIDLETLSLIPFGEGKSFDITADTISYQKTLVPVVEVGTKWKNFMGKYADPRYAKYDSGYDPERVIKFGDMNKPNLSGSWSR